VKREAKKTKSGKPRKTTLGRPVSAETRLKISAANKGKLCGIKRNPESVKAGALKRTKGSFFYCIECGGKFWRQPSAIKLGQNKYCSRLCYQVHQKGIPKMSGFKLRPLIGANSPSWKGGVTPENTKIRASAKYKKWRESVFKRDKYICQDCGVDASVDKSVYLHAHHIKPFATFKELRFDVNNGISLCKNCHSKKPKGRSVYDIK